MNYRSSHLNLSLVVASIIWLSALCGILHAATDLRIFDGKPKKILHLSNNSWGLDLAYVPRDCGYNYIIDKKEHFNGVPINDSMKVVAGSWLSAMQPFANDTPVIAIMSGQTDVPVQGPGDTLKINFAIKKLQTFAAELKKKGVVEVFFTNCHRSVSRPFRKAYFSNHAPVFEKYNLLSGKRMCIDVYTPSLPLYPYICASDLEHPNICGKKIYGTEWTRALLEYDGLPLPSIAVENLRKAYVSDSITISKLRITLKSPQNPASLKVGDQVTLEIHADQSYVNAKKVHVSMLVYRQAECAQLNLVDSMPIASTKFDITLTIPDSVSGLYMYQPSVRSAWPVLGDSILLWKRGPVIYLATDSAQFQATIGVAANSFGMTSMFKLLDRSGKPPVSSAQIMPQNWWSGFPTTIIPQNRTTGNLSQKRLLPEHIYFFDALGRINTMRTVRRNKACSIGPVLLFGHSKGHQHSRPDLN